MKKYTRAKNILFKLCSVAAVSGDEAKTLSLCRSLLPKSAEVTSDGNGNIIAVIGNKNSEKTLLFDAHMDQIGMRVTNISKKGFLRAAKCGGLDSRVLQGSAVTVHGKIDIPAIISSTPPHLFDGDKDEACDIDKLWIDTGIKEEKLSKLVEPGDSVTFCCEPKVLLNGRVSAIAADNRAGVASLIRTAEILEEKSALVKVVLLFSSSEELNALGAKTGAYSIDPDECICVDVSFAKQPFGGYATLGILGDGPMLCISSTLDHSMIHRIKKIAKKEGIPFQTEVCAGTTGTNADHISLIKSGVKTALVSIPQENMHTQAEIVDLEDIENTARLLAAYALQGGTADVQ